jgi:NitT/TauT family transport system substrate-binding protein
MKRHRAILDAGAALGAVAFGARAFAADAPVRIAALTIDASAACYYAQEQGFFKNAGIDADIQGITSGGAIVAAVASNAIDVGFANLVSVVAAFSRNLPVTIVAPGSVDVDALPTNALIVAPGSAIRTGSDLNGKIMATSTLRNIVQFAAQLWVDKHGGDSTTIRFVEMPFSAMADALVAGRIDAAIVAEPFMSDVKSRTRVIAYPMSAIGPRVQLGGWLANTTWARANPAAVLAFDDAIVKANEWGNAHHDLSAQILAKHGHLNVDVLSKMNRATYATRLVAAEMQPAIDVAARYGAIAQSIPAEKMLFNSNRPPAS